MSTTRTIRFYLTLALLIFLTGCWKIEWPSEQERKEAALKEDLYTLRNAIDQFTEDRNSAPQTLYDLIHAGYLRQLPIDPFTGSRTTWHVVIENLDGNAKDTPRGITDVHSGSDAVSSAGTPYDTW